MDKKLIAGQVQEIESESAAANDFERLCIAHRRLKMTRELVDRVAEVAAQNPGDQFSLGQLTLCKLLLRHHLSDADIDACEPQPEGGDNG